MFAQQCKPLLLASVNPSNVAALRKQRCNRLSALLHALKRVCFSTAARNRAGEQATVVSNQAAGGSQPVSSVTFRLRVLLEHMNL